MNPETSFGGFFRNHASLVEKDDLDRSVILLNDTAEPGVVEKKDDKTAGKPGTSAKTAHQLQSDNDSVSQKENQDPKSKADRNKKTPTSSSSTTSDSSSTSNSTSRLSRKRGVNGKEKDSKSSASLASSSSTSEAATSGPTTHTSLLHEEIDGKFHFTKIAETSWNPFKKIVSDLMFPFGDRPPLKKIHN